MQTSGQDLFRAILRLAKATVKPAFSDMGVTLTFDLSNLELSGTFRIPLNTEIDTATGEYIITAQDFANDLVPPP